MNQSKIHSQGNVPFAWENKPGVCKARRDDEDCPTDTGHFVIKLQPPPCPLEKGRPSVHGSQIPLPPCTFQGPPSRNSSKKGHLRKQEDPFLAAYKECTKNTRKGHGGKTHLGRSSMFNLSCKHSCNVRDDNLVSKSRLSALVSRVEREKGGGRGRDDDRKWLNPWSWMFSFFPSCLLWCSHSYVWMWWCGNRDNNVNLVYYCFVAYDGFLICLNLCIYRFGNLVHLCHSYSIITVVLRLLWAVAAVGKS